MSRREQNSLLATLLISAIFGTVLYQGSGSWLITVGWVVAFFLVSAHWFYVGIRHFLDRSWHD